MSLCHYYLNTTLPSKYLTGHERRFEAFKDGLSEVDGLNEAVKARNGTEVYGITKFSDFYPFQIRTGTVERKKNVVKFFPIADMHARGPPYTRYQYGKIQQIRLLLHYYSRHEFFDSYDI